MANRSDLTATDTSLVVPAARGISRRRVVGTAAWAAPAIVVASAVPSFASSPGSPVVAVTQNFDTLASGLPTGVTVFTGARNSFPGTAGTFTATKTPWTNTSAGFYNVAAADAAGLTVASTTAQQDAATDRALGLLATGTAEQDGLAVVVRLGPTTGRTNVTVQLNAQQVGSVVATNPRIATFTIDAGDATTKFATATPTFQISRGAFGSTTVNASFGSALDNLPDDISIRIAILALTTGAGNRPFCAIDDLTISWT